MAYKDFPDDEIEEFGRKASWMDANQGLLRLALEDRIERLEVARRQLGAMLQTATEVASEYLITTRDGVLLKLAEVEQVIAESEKARDSFCELLEPSE